MVKLGRSKRLFEEARKLTPGGVHSGLRYFDPYPIFISKANGSKIYDADGNEYIDYHLAFGPVVLGHSNPQVSIAVRNQLDKGVIFGLSNELEVEVTKKISKHVPSAEMVRFCNSGTEATYHAIRVAKAYSHNEKIVKFEGAYHGWHDCVSFSSGPSLSEAGPRESPVSVPDTDGLGSDVAKKTIVVPFNNPEAVEKVIKRHKGEIAALITEPILHGSSSCVVPRKDFLKQLREITDQNDIVLIFDEVVSGFRHNLGGAQKIFNVTPDLTTFGKAMANGFPVAAVCGRKDIVEMFKPTGKVDYGGTFNGNPISMAATLATISELERGDRCERLFDDGEKFRKKLGQTIIDLHLKAQVVGFGSIFQPLFTDRKIHDYRDTLSSNKEQFKQFQNGMMDIGIFILPQANKRCHISTAHSKEDLDCTIQNAEEILRKIKREN
jgi:glutamate-1-semialdehyde 2,1-aminomutase